MAKRKSKKRKKKNGRAGKVLPLILGILIGFCIFEVHHLNQPVDVTAEDASQLVMVTEGETPDQIGEDLKEKGLIRSSLYFKLRSRLFGQSSKFQTGSYRFSPFMYTSEMIASIANGETAGTVFTIAEGTPLYKIASHLAGEKIMTEEEFYDEVEHGQFDYDFIQYLPDGPERLEGFLYPDTYQAGEGESAHDIIDAMLARFDQVVGSDRNILETVTKASIIQKEAGSDPDEMKLVSSVIDNRIAAAMPLQMDSIVSYIHQEDKIRATYSDIAVDSDYNPYKNKGLPPGPICSPGNGAIQAAKEPADTKYLYFVASSKMDGTNVFSETYEEFLKDKKAFDKAYEKYIKEHPDEK